ncbi:sugar ABC transporter permease [[Clostridium] cellulosi]|jgi:Binding-protein-dependent transport system inner membrane component.|uniref:Sugar ABC transporter permease n=1 Tax=[Clostridium] cellulosi TaxID=29343 RepID=A0A078KN49_9FIRM|nr:sugar ABC transporter permease [[Clostridium] cellulosi]
MKNKNIPICIGKIILYICLIIWAILCLFPIYWLFTFSLKNNTEIFGGNIIGLPKVYRWGNYSNALLNGNVGIYLFNSFVVTALTILFTILASTMATFAMQRMRWKLSKVAMSILLVGMMIPIHAALLPVFVVMRNLKLINTIWSLIIPYTGFAIPMGILIISGILDGIPRELDESACIDGCNTYRLFFSIILPLLRPAIATCAVFTFLQSWNELMMAVTFISKDNAKTLTVGIQSMAGQYLTEWGPIGAALMIATIPTLILYFMLSGQVQKSFVVGAVKG